ARTGLQRSELGGLLAKMTSIVRIDDHLLARSEVDNLRKGLVNVLDGFHKQNPLVAGISKEELRGRFPEVEPAVFEQVFQEELRAKKLELAGELVRLPGRGVVMKDDEAES